MRPDPDPLLITIATQARQCPVTARDIDIARSGLMAALACAFAALRSGDCTRLVRPLVPGAVMPGGARVPGTSFELDPVQAAFSLGVLVSEARADPLADPPSEHLAALLAVADYLARRAILQGSAPPQIRDVLAATIRATQIHAWLARENDLGMFDDSLLTRVASTAVVTALLGASAEQIVNAVSNAWLDGPVLAAYTGAHPGSRKRWAAADATSRGVRHALLALRGEMGYPAALTAKTWGFCDVLLAGQPLAGHGPVGGKKPSPRRTPTAPDARTARARLDAAVDDWFLPRQAERIKALFADPKALDVLPVNELMAELVCIDFNRQGRLALD